MRSLQRLGQKPLTDFGTEGPLDGNAPKLPVEAIGRIARPDREDLIDTFQKHRVAIDIEVAEGFGIRQQPAGADAENESTVEQMVEHGNLTGDHHRMAVGNVY